MSRLTVLEALGGPRERIRAAPAEAFAIAGIDPLNVLAVEAVAGPDARLNPLAAGLPDAMFESDGQLTKREIRAVTLSSLRPLPGQLLWDVGLGAGSVAIEWLRADPSMRAIGFEAREDRAARAAGNAARLGVPRLAIVVGQAPESFAGQAAPDAVFLGGGAGDPGVFAAAFAALRPGGRLVANAVSIETEALLSTWFRAHGGTLTRLAVERAVAGRRHAWLAPGHAGDAMGGGQVMSGISSPSGIGCRKGCASAEIVELVAHCHGAGRPSDGARCPASSPPPSSMARAASARRRGRSACRWC